MHGEAANLITDNSQELLESRPYKDYSHFDPRKYVQEYYSEIGAENSFLLNFYHKVYSQISKEATLLEFGGGPTIYQLLSAAQNVKQIVFADYLESNRLEVVKWLNKDTNSIDWTDYLNYVLQLENKDTTEASREAFKNKLKSKVTDIIECDAYLPNVLSGYHNLQFDVVSSGFCLECISNSESDYRKFIQKISELVLSKGSLVMTVLKNSNYYKINDLIFPTFPVDEQYLSSLLSQLGFSIEVMDSVAAEHDQGYEGIIALMAKKQ